MIIYYWYDLMGDPDEEIDAIKKQLSHFDVDLKFKFRKSGVPMLDKKFDVLFFDWGGMSIGNSLMESFCREILFHAQEHPSKIYIMTSSFTEQAMKDMMIQYRNELKDTSNVFLNIKSAAPYLKELIEVEFDKLRSGKT